MRRREGAPFPQCGVPSVHFLTIRRSPTLRCVGQCPRLLLPRAATDARIVRPTCDHTFVARRGLQAQSSRSVWMYQRGNSSHREAHTANLGVITVDRTPPAL